MRLRTQQLSDLLKTIMMAEANFPLGSPSCAASQYLGAAYLARHVSPRLGPRQIDRRQEWALNQEVRLPESLRVRPQSATSAARSACVCVLRPKAPTTW